MTFACVDPRGCQFGDHAVMNVADVNLYLDSGSGGYGVRFTCFLVDGSERGYDSKVLWPDFASASAAVDAINKKYNLHAGLIWNYAYRQICTLAIVVP
jgi:hypothetical protein